MGQQSSSVSVTTSAYSQPTTSMNPTPSDSPSTSKYFDTGADWTPATLTDHTDLKNSSASKMASYQREVSDDDSLKKPAMSNMSSFQGNSTMPSEDIGDDLQKTSASKMATSQSQSTTLMDDYDLKKPSASTSQSATGSTQVDKPAVKSQTSGSSDITQKSLVTDNEVVTQPTTVDQMTADSSLPLGTCVHIIVI